MTDKYPLLTVESVKYWYWECDPAYSLIDIAKVIGVNQATVYRFMVRNGIPRRNRSEANVNRFKCAHKKEAFVRRRNTHEFKKNQSQNITGYWLDPTMRKKMMDGFTKYIESKLGVFQVQILYLLRNSEGLFLSDLVKIINKDKTILDGRLRTLHQRGLVARQKQINHNTRNSYALHYYYSITEQGVSLLAEKEEELRFASLFESLETTCVRNSRDIKENYISTYLGKNQEVILNLFQRKSPLFLTDLKKLTSINSKILDRSLKGLFTRGILSRKKEINPNSLNHLMHFKYRLTEVGNKIQIE